ncbi:MAG: hypothetical protein PHC34_04625 [Candidatus Gastranaerophilales bacterium]|nr:hypothetical protein [Candidatus Gastranaerophilales bacterium]
MSLTVSNFNLYSTIASSNDLVSSNEVANISKELLSVAPSTQSASAVANGQNLPKINFNKFDSLNNGLKLFGAEAQLSTQNLEQIATNKAGYNVTLSDKALTSINSLNAQAAKLQASAISRQMDGKVYVNAEVAGFSDLKSVFAASNSPKTFDISNMNKDGRGSNPFFVAKNEDKKQEETKESLSIFA